MLFLQRHLPQKIGFTGLKNYIKRVLERMFKHQLSTKYSWTVFRENNVKNLKIMKMMKGNFLTKINFVDVTHNVVLLLSIAISTFAETEANFEGHLTDWFSHGSQRYTREQQQKLNHSAFFTYIFVM